MYFGLINFTHIDDMTVPVYGTKFITENRITGRIFNDYAFGGYLLWQYPTEKIFIDGRQEIYPGKPTLEFMAINNVSSVWSNLLDQYQINYIILAPGRDLNIPLLKHPNWDLVYFDSTSVIYLKHGTFSHIPRLKNITPIGNRNPKDINTIIEEYNYLLSQNPKFCFGYQTIAEIYLNQGNFKLAESYFNQLISMCPQRAIDPKVKEIKTFLNTH